MSYDKLEYVTKLALSFSEIYLDDNRNEHIVPHHSCFMSDRDIDRALQHLDISKESFLKQEQIIPVIEAYRLDKEKFWLATVYIAHLTWVWAERKGMIKRLPPAHEQFKKLRDEITGRNEFKVLIDNPTECHTIEMAGKRVIELLVLSLDKLVQTEVSSVYANLREVPLWRNDVTARKTEMTWYAVNMFKHLFDILKLPIIRSKSIKKEYRTLAGEDVLVKGKDAFISYDKNQLIAELIHFLGLTDNPNLDGNSIKAILKGKRKFDIEIF